MKVLFVCEGNMIRSQMAEAFYNDMTNSHEASSAGAIAEPNEHISLRAIQVLDEVAIDAHFLRPTLVTNAMVGSADKVVYFPSDFMPDFVKAAKGAELWDVVDPHYHQEQGIELVRSVRDEIRAKVKMMVKESA